jgi:hypothetical protein
MAPTLTPDRQTFRALVADVAARAKARLPEAVNGRIESAVKLVLVQDVTPQDDGSILVGSSSDPLKTYRLVGPTCECQDFTRGQAPGGWCQHCIAAGIQKRVGELLAAQEPAPVLPEGLEPWPDNDPEEAPAPAPEPPAAPLPEAGGVDRALLRASVAEGRRQILERGLQVLHPAGEERATGLQGREEVGKGHGGCVSC